MIRSICSSKLHVQGFQQTGVADLISRYLIHMSFSVGWNRKCQAMSIKTIFIQIMEDSGATIIKMSNINTLF